jgi:hypothetical protein
MDVFGWGGISDGGTPTVSNTDHARAHYEQIIIGPYPLGSRQRLVLLLSFPLLHCAVASMTEHRGVGGICIWQ